MKSATPLEMRDLEQSQMLFTSILTRDVSMVIIVYDITSKDSFEGVKGFAKKVKQKGIQTGVLVGNKVDKSSERKVSTSEGSSLAIELGFQFREISATLTNEVGDLFTEIVHQFCQKNKV